MEDNQKLSRSMEENIACLREIFGTSTDFYTKEFCVGQVRCSIALFTGLSSPEKLTVMALSLLEQERVFFTDGETLASHLLTQSCIPAEGTPVTTCGEMIERLANGLALFLIDGSARAVALSTQEMPQRSDRKSVV